jgi:glycine C-acetyltransferase/8-amino-7-oxononanoate synthase
MIEPAPLQQIDRTHVRFHGRKLSYFSGCDYFRLAHHPKLIAAVQQGARRFGLNVAASRLTTGNHVLYGELEQRLARFFGAPDALLVSSGYMTNLVVAQALAGNFSHALLDDESHPSLADAARLLECPVVRFRHLNPESLASAARRCGPGARVLVLTDGMFSDNGAAAPLAEYLKVLPKDAELLVDDAHAAGVIGRRGRGSLEHAGVSRRRILQTVSLSKAFGAFGGAILGTAELRGRIAQKSSIFVGSTPPPLPMVNAALRSVEMLSNDTALRRRLKQNTAYVRNALRASGLPVANHPGPIVSLVPERKESADQLSAMLLAGRIFPALIKYPGGPVNGYFRFVISSEHTRQQLDRLIRVLTKSATGFSPR